jgi:hypothetical protein
VSLVMVGDVVWLWGRGASLLGSNGFRPDLYIAVEAGGRRPERRACELRTRKPRAGKKDVVVVSLTRGTGRCGATCVARGMAS